MFGLLRRAFMTTPDERARRRAEQQQELREYREDQAAMRLEDETCSYCRGSKMCHFCGGARNNSVHELGSECRHCRDGRCPYCN